jgi:hypothetical protein
MFASNSMANKMRPNRGFLYAMLTCGEYSRNWRTIDLESVKKQLVVQASRLPAAAETAAPQLGK